MEIDDIKKCWKEEDRHISENIHINKDVSFQKLRSSFNRIKVWRLVRIVQWFIVMPLLFVWIIIPHMKNDGSGLFYAAFVLFICIVISFCISYIYHYVYLSKIDFSESILNVQKKISRSEVLDKRIYILRFALILVAFLCAYKIFGTISLKSGGVMQIALFIFIMVYALVVRLRFLIPKEYNKVRSCLDEMEDEEDENKNK